MIVRGSAVEPTPWANGGGLTRELYVERDDDGSPRRRLSMAEVSGAGEFSPLPGVARSLLLVSGAVELSFDGGPWSALTGEPIEFDGATPVRYRAARPSEDLGVMSWTGTPARLRVVEVDGQAELPGAWAWVVLAGTLVLDGASLGHRDAVIGARAARVAGDAVRMVIIA